jgi:hypothetical protein
MKAVIKKEEMHVYAVSFFVIMASSSLAILISMLL